jgi:hypothetical protein
MHAQSRHARFGLWSFAVVAVLIAATMVRALVPAGYMLAPVKGDETSGLFKLTICSSVASATGGPSDPSEPVQAPSGDGQPCGFAAAIADAIPRDGAVAISIVPTGPVTHTVDRAFLLPPLISGPQLGARAPPANV